MHLRLTMILRVDVRSAMAQENTSHAVTGPRMVAELDVAFTDQGSFWYSGAAASVLLDGGICSVIEHQQDQLMYQQEVIDEARAARTPVPNMLRNTEENQLTPRKKTSRRHLRLMKSPVRNSQMWKRIRWENCPCLERTMLGRSEKSSLRSC